MPIETKPTIKITLQPDSDVECPIGESGDARERIVTFNRRHSTYVDPEEFFDDYGNLKIGIRRQLETKTAFIISCYEHGAVQFGLQGEVHSCPWDTAQVAGIYWLPSDVPMAERERYARAALERYTEWCNGWCFWFMVEEVREEQVGPTRRLEETHLDSCGGFFNSDKDHVLTEYLVPAIVSHLRDGELKAEDVEFEVVGDYRDILDSYDVREAVEAALATEVTE